MTDLEMQKQVNTSGHVLAAAEMIHDYMDTHNRPKFLRLLGCAGCVTNESFRDLEDWMPGFQIPGGRVGPSYACMHLVDFGGEVTVHGKTAQYGDILHADRKGAVTISASAVAGLPDAVALCQAREALVLAAARNIH